jgi:hypothetical protein
MARRLLLVVLVLVTTALPTTASAQESNRPGDFLCQMGGRIVFRPKLSSQPQDVSWVMTGTLSPCRTKNPRLFQGTFFATGSGNMRCNQGTAGGGGKITWNDGSGSSVRFRLGNIGPAMGLEGRIWNGRFEDSLFGAAGAMAPQWFECASQQLRGTFFRVVIGSL